MTLSHFSLQRAPEKPKLFSDKDSRKNTLEETIASVAQDSQKSGLVPQQAERLMQSFAVCDYDILRVKAIQGLRDIKAKDSQDVLIAALRDDDEDVRVDAAEALGCLGCQDAISNLIENLTYDPCADVKLSAICALHQLSATGAAPILRQLVVGRGDEVVWDEDEVHMDEWDGWLDIQIAAIRALGDFCDEQAVEPIVTAMNDPEGQDIDIYALEAFRKIGKAALPTIAICARSPRRLRRLYAVRAASVIAGDGALKILQEAMKDADDTIRLVAFEALLKRAPDADLFMAALEDDNEQIRIAAYGRLELDEAGFLERALSDPSPKVQLALINRLSSVGITNTDDPVFKALSLLMESTHSEVSASALAVLAVSIPQKVKREIEDLFEKDEGNPDIREQSQWAVVDALTKHVGIDSLYWLEQATASAFRSVRLKALAGIGQILTGLDAEDPNREVCVKLLEAFAVKKVDDPQVGLPEDGALDEVEQSAEADDANMPSEPVDALADLGEASEAEVFENQNQEDIAGMKAAGLDLGDERDQTDGPTSSLGAILGHEAIAQDLIAEAEEETNRTELSLDEQALLNQARRNLSRRKIDLDGDAEQIEWEMGLTAIHLLGDHVDSFDILVELASDHNPDISMAALDSIKRILVKAESDDDLRDKLILQAEPLRPLVETGLYSSHVPVRLGILRLLPSLDVQEDLLEALSDCLGDGEARIRSEAMEPYLSWGGDREKVLPLLEDGSSMVRQSAMGNLARFAPDLAVDHIVDFLINNPELSLKSMLGSSIDDDERSRLAAMFVRRLNQSDRKAQWGIILTALSDCYA